MLKTLKVLTTFHVATPPYQGERDDGSWDTSLAATRQTSGEVDVNYLTRTGWSASLSIEEYPI